MNSARMLSVGLASILVVSAGVWLMAQSNQPGGPQPSFGTLVASPPNFVINTPTTLTFTVRIDTPTLNPTTVELQRVDAQGNLVSSVGRMYDNGQGGDPVADDRNFTARLLMNESSVARLYFRVAAAFRGNSQSAASVPTFVDVDPFALPPDPGEVGRQTLEGIDSDGDGVRDDVQRYIGLSQAANLSLRRALLQLAGVEQSFLTALLQKNILESIDEQRIRAHDCLEYHAGPVVARDLVLTLQAEMLNTGERSRAYTLAMITKGAKALYLTDEAALRQGCNF